MKILIVQDAKRHADAEKFFAGQPDVKIAFGTCVADLQRHIVRAETDESAGVDGVFTEVFIANAQVGYVIQGVCDRVGIPCMLKQAVHVRDDGSTDYELALNALRPCLEMMVRR